MSLHGAQKISDVSKRRSQLGACLCAGKNTELVEKMEALFNVWHSQIEQVLTEHEQIRREADNIGPDVELQYWKNRMDKFHMYTIYFLHLLAAWCMARRTKCRGNCVLAYNIAKYSPI